MANAASPSIASRGRGRPREFDVDAALDKAVRVFRERGYHATSIADLTEAMELASGSVYKAFKDKRAVFLAAFDREGELRGEKLRRILGRHKSGRDRIRETLIFYAEASHGVEGKRGCLVVGSAAELTTFDAALAQRVTAAIHGSESLLSDLIGQGQADGSISAAIDRKATARLMLCLLQGMRVVGKTGRSGAEMTAVADTAMKLLG
ncbi:MAG TPA: TetR/AcrR family transcriptional regulator [Pseudolabrys sp.]|jgi:AcrR family transcriptional regulator